MEKRITNALKKGSIDEAEKEINKLAYLQSIRMRLMDSIRG